MAYCPRCGTTVSPLAERCPRCGLPRPQGQPAPPVQPFRPPIPAQARRSHTGAAVAVLAAVLLVVGVAAVAVMWVTGTGPLGSGVSARDDQARPDTAATTTATEPESTSGLTTGPSTSASVTKDFSDVYAAVESGVGLVKVDTCGGAVTGSGFLVGRGTLVTAAHVIDGATDVHVEFDGTEVDATVVGIESSLDLAVLAIPLPPTGRHVFDLAGQDPDTGTHIAVIGYPLDEPKSLTEGTISGLDRTITTESGTYTGLLQTDAAINPGNSGGPLLNSAGEIVGVADAIRQDAQGIGFAVPISRARGAIESGAGLSLPVQPPCAPPPDSVHAGVQRTLHSYLTAINERDYDTAMSLVSDAIRAANPQSQWETDYSTTRDDQLRVLSVKGAAPRAQVWATFRSRQAPGYGPTGAKNATCLLWSLDYDMVASQSTWIIDDVSMHVDPPWVRCD